MFKEEDHPRLPKGSENGGEFTGKNTVPKYIQDKLDPSDKKKLPITEEEKKAVTDYTNSDYVGVNRYLRGKTQYLDPKDQTTIKNMDSFLEKSTSTGEIESWRGLRLSEKDYNQLKSNATQGAQLIDKGFMSTSRDKSTGNMFSQTSQENFHSVVVTVKGRNGVQLTDDLTDMDGRARGNLQERYKVFCC